MPNNELYHMKNIELIDFMHAQGRVFELSELDPNWDYTNTGGASKKFRGTAKAEYTTSSLDEHIATIRYHTKVTTEDAIMLLWATPPLLFGSTGPREELIRKYHHLGPEELIRILQTGQSTIDEVTNQISDIWQYKTAWFWIKRPAGVGWWTRSSVEPILVFTRAKSMPKRLADNFKKCVPQDFETEFETIAVQEKRGAEHSHKPVGMLQKLIERYTLPEENVLSLWSGMYPTGRAAKACGRNSVGCEPDIDRYELGRKYLEEIA